jgi:hypothetical protein
LNSTRAKFSLTVLIVLTWATVASAGAAPASGAAALQAWLDGAEQPLKSAQQSIDGLRARQRELKAQLARVAVDIEELKRQSKGKLLKSGALDASLRQSQALSESLTDLATELSIAEQSLERSRSDSIEVLTARLSQLRTEVEAQPTRAARQEKLEAMRSIRSVRDALRSQLKTVDLPAASVGTSDGTEALEDVLEKRDTVTESLSVVQKELRTLNAQLAERKADAELEKRLSRFASEESAFDDQDRRLRFQQRDNKASPAASTRTASYNEGATGSPSSAPPQSDAPAPAGAGAGGGPPSAGGNPNPNPNPIQPPAQDKRTPSTGSDARPQIGGVRSGTLSSSSDAQLEAQRASLQKLEAELKKRQQLLSEQAKKAQ